MANEIKVTVKGDDQFTEVSKKAKENAERDAKGIAKAFESSSKDMGSAFDKAGDKADDSFRAMARDADRESNQIERHFGNAFDGVKTAAHTLGGVMSTAIGTAVGVIGSQIITQISEPFTEFVGGAVEASSQLADSMNAVNRVFGSAAQPILDWGDNVANMFGLSQRQFNQLAVPLGAMLKNTGMEMDAVAENTLGLTMRAADMASVFGGEVADAMQAIQAGLRGEADPLERYGVGLSAAAVEAHALSMGLGKAEVDLEKVHIAQLGAAIANTKYQQEVAKTGRGSLEAAQKEKALISANEALEKAMAGGKVELTDQEKMLARISLLMQQTADATGDHVAASDEHANASKNAAAAMEEEQAKLGTALIPLTMKATEVKLALAKALVEHGIPAFEKFQGFVGEHVIPRLRQLGGWIRDEGIPAIQDFGKWVGDNVVPKLREFGDWINDEGLPAARQLGSWFAEHMSPNLEKAQDILVELIPKFREMGDTLVEKFQEVKPELQAFAEFMMDKVIPAVLFLVDKVTLLLVPAFKAILESYALTIHAAGDVITWFKNIGNTAGEVAGTISGAFVEAFNTVIRIWNGLEFSLPGGPVGTMLFGPLAGKTFGTPDVQPFRTGATTGGDRGVSAGGGLRRMAAGGITTGPTLALIGDNPGGREAVIPLPPGGGGGLMGAVFNVYALTKADAARGVADALAEAKRLGYIA